MDGWHPKQGDIIVVKGKVERHVFRVPEKDPRWPNVNSGHYSVIPLDKDLVMPWKEDPLGGCVYATWCKYSYHKWKGEVRCIVMGWSYKLIGEIIPSSGREWDYEQGHLNEWNRFRVWTVFEIDKHDRYHAPFPTLLEFMEKK